MRKRWYPTALALLVVLGCSPQPEPVVPPTVEPLPAEPSAPAGTDPEAVAPGPEASNALRNYLREQALAVNAGVADAEQVPGFLATLTPGAADWALPLLAENLGDRMPGPYPSGVLATEVVTADRVELRVCLQDRGWQVDRTTGETLNEAHHGTARAVVVRLGDRWVLDDLVSDGGSCSAADVVEERF